MKLLSYCLAVVALLCPLSTRADVPLPTPDILEWTKLEVGAFYSFNMISMLENISNTQFFCLGVGGDGGWLPDTTFFNPKKLNIDQWLDTAKSFGAKYAVLTATHCSGFSMWPTDVFIDSGFNYTYSTLYAPLGGGDYDVVKEFVSSCRKAGIKPGIYYSLNQNYYLNSGGGVVKNTTLVPGQAKVSQEVYEKIVLAQMKELWTNYGQLSEIWFDGGCSVPGINDQVSELLEKLQPHAVYFGGCAKKNNIRWVGTESGEPKYPIWSTAQNCAAGLGDPDGNIFCPAESDTTLQEGDHWFYRKGFPIRSLDELKSVYINTVGHNTNLLLNVAANSDGLIADASVQRYKEFGDWINSCFYSNNTLVSRTVGRGNLLKIQSDKSMVFDTIVLQENQTNGQNVLAFHVSVVTSGNDFSAKKERDGARETPEDLRVIVSGTSIGHKAIFTNFSSKPTVADGVMVTVTDYKSQYHTEVVFSLHLCNGTHS